MKSDIRRVKAMAYGMSLCFLFIHILMISIFYQCHVDPMVRVNVVSIAFYFIILFIIHMEWFPLFALSVYIEVAIHMTVAVLYTGWNSGFQITLIGMNVLAFYAEYVGRSLKIKYIPMMPAGILGMMLYLGSYVILNYAPPQYNLPSNVEFWLSILWGVVVFSINLFVLQVFVSLVSSSERKLEHQMSHDKLTGLPNRYYMSNHLEMVKEKEGLKEYWIAIADIDDFKKVNDTYGHNCGDYVLRTVAELTENNDNILCCRWGGEEFIFMGRKKGDDISAFVFLDGLREKISNYPFHFEGTDLKVTMTIGLAMFFKGRGIDAWISEADAKLYQGKQAGKNQVVR